MKEQRLKHGSVEDIERIIRGRRSVRKFDRRAVSREQLMQLIEAASWAPSPHGRQPWRFAVVTQQDTREKLALAMGERWQQQLALDGQEQEIVLLRLAKSRERISTAPAIVVPCLYMTEMDEYPDAERQDAEHLMAVQSLGCAIQNMLLLAYSMGLDCGWMCAPLFCPDTVRGALDLKPPLEPHALITIGYAAQEPVRRPRRSLDKLVVFYD
jgi:F420 biosynthesis protein FbiB-like protein